MPATGLVRRLVRSLGILAFLHFCISSPASASERYALIVTGASGGPQYSAKYDAWRDELVKSLGGSLGYPGGHLVVLAETAEGEVRQATRENVRESLEALRRRMTAADQLLVVLIGHGTGTDPDDAKFNLVGPDLTAAEWAALLRGLPGRLVFVNTTGGSFAFLQTLSGKDRVVVTANDSPAQQFETVFPEFLIGAMSDEDADLDKSGKVSIWEAFVTASDRVRRAYEEKGQLATERPMLDDTGDGHGVEAREAGGADGVLARTTYFAAEPAIGAGVSPARAALLRRRAELGAALDQLRARKPTLQSDEYEQALERVLLEIARVDRQLRTTS